MANSHKTVTRANAHPPGEVSDFVDFSEQGSNPASPAATFERVFVKSDGVYVKNSGGAVTGPFGAGSGSAPTQRARVYNNANITISNTTVTALTFNSERWDTDSIHSTVSNTSRLTCNTPGSYIIGGHLQCNSGSTPPRLLVTIRLNGTTDIASVEIGQGNSTTFPQFSITTEYDLTATDYVELTVYQSSGGNMTINASANQSPEFWMTRVQ